MTPTKKDKDITWNHCESINGNRLYLKCKYCSHPCWGGVSRMKHHLGGSSKDVSICTSVPDDVKELFSKMVDAMKKAKEAAKQVDVVETQVALKEKQGTSSSLKQTTMNQTIKDRDVVIQDICNCIYGNALPFNLVRSSLFVKMLKSVGEYGKGLKSPTYHEVRVSYLKKAVEKVKESLEKYKNEWEKWGCTLMCDGWTDGKNRSLTNFLVNSPSGTVFLKSIDTSNVIKDAKQMFSLLDSMVEEIGADNVVKVVTDGAANLVAAGRLLEEKRKKLFWSPCAAHCLDLILEDIGKIPVFYKTIADAKKVTTYIYRHSWVLNLYRDFSDGELARPAVTRFATAYLTLQCIKDQKTALQSMFVSEKWTTSNYASKVDAKKVVDIVLYDPRFWRVIQYCLNCVSPLVKVLRMVDGDAKPAMPCIYVAMERAKEEIATKFKNQESRYNKVWNLIDTRWNLQLHRPLHAAAYYLNPKFHYQKDFNPPANEIMYGLYEVFHKMAPDTKSRVLIDRQLEQFKAAKGLFGLPMAIETRNLKQPALWWESYGGEGRELQQIAIRVLSLTCSATGCERNWSVFDQIHTKRRNRLEQQRLNALVYVKYNLQLEMRQKTREEKGDHYDPIYLSDIESDDEWITEKENPCLPLDDAWMDIHESFTFEEGAPSKKRKIGPRNLNASFKKGKEKAITFGDESEVEEIIANAEEGEEHLEIEEDELSDN